MAKKTKSNAEVTVAQPTTTAPETTQTPANKLIVAKQTTNGRWYVYFQGIPPKDNVGCSCKTAQSAIRYMYLLKKRHGAVISQKCYERLQAEANVQTVPA